MSIELISAIRIQKLFGLYTYSLPTEGVLSNASILYGDNGVGKSTILRLVFHLLSASNSQGHRGALYASDFQKLEVDLSSGVTLTAHFEDENQSRILILEILKDKKTIARWDYRPQKGPTQNFDFDEMIETRSDGSWIIRHSQFKSKTPRESISNESNYIFKLKEFAPTIFILNADRRLNSDAVADPSDEVELRRVMRYEEPKKINEFISRSRDIALSQALANAGRWVAQKAVIGNNQGSMNVHSVYVDVLHHLIKPTHKEPSPPAPIEISHLTSQLSIIEQKTEAFAKYELATKLSTVEFKKALSTRTPTKNQLAAELLQPYIKSLEGRLNGLDSIYNIVDRFVTTVNSFLNDKRLIFKLTKGFSIENKLGFLLKPDQLSSGEQQLLLLFCYVLTARDQPSVFMIDEPEISLNIKWQRQLVQSLTDITEGSKIQFILASHSMELLALHRKRVIKLVNQA